MRARSMFLGMIGCVFAVGLGASQALAVTCTTPTAAAPTGCIAGTIYEGNTPGTSLNGSLGLLKLDEISANPPGVEVNLGVVDYKPNFTFSNVTLLTGHWEFTPEVGKLVPTLLAIKAGNFWYFIELALGQTSGDWNQNKILNPPGNAFLGVSHVSFYDGASVVPVPPALALFLTGLVGLGILSRRRRKAAQQAA